MRTQARTTLNGLYAGGVLVVAAVLGLMTGSSLVFIISFGILVVLSLRSKRIRLRPLRCHRCNH